MTPLTPGGANGAARDLAADRTDYLAGSLADEAPADPLALFDAWMQDAFARREEHGDLPDPTAVVLATVDLTGPAPRPRTRTVLLKAHDADGFVVFTNKESDKGRELAGDAQASLLLPWYVLQRQVRIEGAITDVADQEADDYFASRPRGSQIGAWASHQSRPVASREALDAQYAEAEARFADSETVPRPPHWGGYRLRPERIEFWQGRASRMHDRIVFTLGADGSWSRERLQP